MHGLRCAALPPYLHGQVPGAGPLLDERSLDSVAGAPGVGGLGPGLTQLPAERGREGGDTWREAGGGWGG